MEVCREDLAAKNIRVETGLSARHHQVRGDVARLEQVFWNLFKNAAKFTPKGGSLAVRSRDAEDGIVVEVADSGVGISAEALPKIFDPFEQGDPDRMQRFGGLGLGLAISHAIVAAHGGKLAAESPGRDRGTNFRVEYSALEGPG